MGALSGYNSTLITPRLVSSFTMGLPPLRAVPAPKAVPQQRRRIPATTSSFRITTSRSVLDKTFYAISGSYRKKGIGNNEENHDTFFGRAAHPGGPRVSRRRARGTGPAHRRRRRPDLGGAEPGAAGGDLLPRHRRNRDTEGARDLRSTPFGPGRLPGIEPSSGLAIVLCRPATRFPL